MVFSVRFQLATCLLVLAATVWSVSGAKLTIHGRAEQTHSEQHFKVTVANPEGAALGDVVAVYQRRYFRSKPAPADIVVKQQALKFMFPAAMDATYLKTNTTTLNWILPNYRTDVLFVLFKQTTIGGKVGGFFVKEAIVASKVLKQRNPNEYTQGHVGFVSTNNTHANMIVQWTTRDGLHPAVMWGTTPSHMRGPFLGDFITYTPSDFCGAPANSTGFVDPGALNYVKIVVPRGAKIFYKFGSASKKSYSRHHSFSTPPAPFSSAPTKLLWIADYGVANSDLADNFGLYSTPDNYPYFIQPPSAGYKPDPSNGARWFAEVINFISSAEEAQGASNYTAAALTKLAKRSDRQAKPASSDYHAFFISGDISYAQGNTAKWEQFWSQTSPIALRVPILPGMGNHERNTPNTGDRFNAYPSLDSDAGGECGIAALKRFLAPAPWTPADPHKIGLPDSPWYSIDLGPIHYIQYSTEHNVSASSPQHNFIVADLAAVNRTLTPFLVVGGHRPMHVSSPDGVDPTSNQLAGEEVLKAFEDLFFLHEVDLILHGHHHSYQRTYPIYKRTVTPGAPVYVVAGNAGYQLTLYIQPTTPDYFQVIKLEHGFLKISATMTSLTVEATSSQSGKQIDFFTLTKPVGYRPAPAARQAVINRMANVSDGYTTKMLSTFSFSSLGYVFGKYIVPSQIGPAFAAYAASRGGLISPDMTTFLTADIDRADVFNTSFVFFDYAYNYLLPMGAKTFPSSANDSTYKYTIGLMQQMVANLKTLPLVLPNK